MEEATNQESNFTASRTAIHMCLINDEEQLVLWGCREPLACRFPDILFPWAQQHVFQHGIVCNENIRTELLHLKARDKLCILLIRDMTALMQVLQESLHIHFCRNFSLLEQVLEKCGISCLPRRRHACQRFFQFMVLRTIRCLARIGRAPRIHAKLRTAHLFAASISENLNEFPCRITNHLT